MASKQGGPTFGTDFFGAQASHEEAVDIKPEEEGEEPDDVSNLADNLREVSLDLSKWNSVPEHSAL